MGPVRIFIAYAHEDLDLLKELLKFLSPLEAAGMIDVFHSGTLTTGVLWSDEVRKRLFSAEIVVLLLSQHFLGSEHCRREMTTAIARAQRSQISLFPVLLTACAVDVTPLSPYQLTPSSTLPLCEWSDRNKAWMKVLNDLRKSLGEVHVRRRSVEALCEELVQEMRKCTDDFLTDHWVLQTPMSPVEIARLIVPLDVDDLTTPAAGKTEPLGFARTLADLSDPQAVTHVYLEGGPGAGKSTYAIHLAREMLYAALDTGASPAVPPRIPIFLQLRDVKPKLQRVNPEDKAAKITPETALVVWLVEMLGARRHIDEARVKELLASGRVVLLLDGLDYVGDQEQRTRFSKSLPKTTPVLITSRIGSVDPASVPGLRHFRLRPFTDKQLRIYIDQWCTHTTAGTAKTEELRRRLLVTFGLHEKGTQTIPLEWTPILATYLAASHQVKRGVPTNRAEVYDRFLSWLFGATLDPHRASHEPEIDASVLRLFLDQIAHDMVEEGRRELPRDELMKRLEKLADEQYVDVTEGWLDYLCDHTGILVERGGNLAFAHLTLLEYLAGRGFRHRHEAHGYEKIASEAVARLGTSKGYAAWFEPLLLALTGVRDRDLAVTVLRRLLLTVQDLLAVLSRPAHGGAPPADASVWEYLFFGLSLISELGSYAALVPVTRELLDLLYECCCHSEEHLSILGGKSRADVAAIADRLRKLAEGGDLQMQTELRAWFERIRAQEKRIPPAVRHSRMQHWGVFMPSVLVGERTLAEYRREDPGGYVQILKLWPYSDLALFTVSQPRCDEIVSWACAETPFHLIAPRALVFLERTWDDGAAAWTVALLRRSAWIAQVTRIACEGCHDDNCSSVRLARDERVAVVNIRTAVVPSRPEDVKADDHGHHLETQIAERALRSFNAKMEHDEKYRPAMRRVTDAFGRSFVQKLPEKLSRFVKPHPAIADSLRETWLSAFAKTGGIQSPYGRDVTNLLRGAEWELSRFEPYATPPAEPSTHEQSEDANQGDADADLLRQRLLIRHWLETLTGVVIGARAGIPNGWLLGSLRAQNWWFYLFWDDLAESLGPSLEGPGHMALMLAAGLAQFQTTWRWPSGRAWSRWFPDAPKVFIDAPKQYWLARCAWHLCWIVSGHDPSGVHQRGLHAALKDGDTEWGALAKALRDLNVKAP